MDFFARNFPLTFVVLFCLPMLVGAQEVKINLEIQGCSEPPVLFEFNGFSFTPYRTATANGEDGYVLTLPQQDPGFFYLGRLGEQPRPVILGPEVGVTFSGHCNNIRQASISKSSLNEDYEVLKQQMNALKQENRRHIEDFRQAKNMEEVEAIIARMGELDARKVAFLDSVKQVNPFFGRIVALNTYLSYFNHGRSKYQNELEYFAKEYFSFADFSSGSYDRLPWVFESFREYSTTLCHPNISEEQQKAFFDGVVEQIPTGSNARQLAYGGIIAALRQRNHPNLLYYSEKFLAEFPDCDAEVRNELKQYIKTAQAFVIGGEAPDFEQETPTGEMLNLSDLRGKVVLVDFWASWCGPCRKENPNVVRVYNQYKDKGFEILGVSLDQNRERWLQAIEKDQLTWQHVSDLQGWKNEVALLYNVRTIPHTILLDKEGRIIARNLRGRALENKLAELFD